MADSKRLSVGPKATPPKASSQGISELDATLQKAANAKVRINTVVAGHAVEGALLVTDPVTNLAVVDTTPEAPTRDLHIITLSNIQDFQILSIGDKKESDEASAIGAETGLPPVTKIDIGALRAREEAAIRRAKERDAQRGKGVTKEAQEIFDWFARTLPARWADQTIVVSDSVLVEAPYKQDNVRGPKDRQPAVVQIKKVLEGYYQKKKGVAQQSQAKPAPAVPVPPRKGG